MDIVLLILLAVGFVSGLISGAVKQLVSLVAFVMGFAIACLYYERLAEVLGNVLSMPVFCKIAAFLLLWFIIPVVARLVSTMLTSILDKLFALGLLNRLLGGTMCTAKYALVLGAFIWFFSSIGLLGEETLQKSRLCRPLKAFPEMVYNTLKAPSHPCEKAGAEEGLR